MPDEYPPGHPVKRDAPACDGVEVPAGTDEREDGRVEPAGGDAGSDAASESEGTRRGVGPGTRLILGVLGAVLVVGSVAAIAIARTYHVDRRRAVDERARLAFESVADSGQYLNGRLDLLATFASRPAFVAGDPAAAMADLRSFPGAELAVTGGVAWFDPDGQLLAAGRQVAEPTSDAVVAEVRSVAAGVRHVSQAVASPEFEGDVVLLAVPTFDGEGAVNGVLAAGVTVEWLRSLTELLDEARGATSFIYDRAGRLLVGGAPGTDPAPMPDVLALEDLDQRQQIRFTGRAGATDPNGVDDRVIGYAAGDPVTGFTVLQVDSESEAFAPARRSAARSSLAVAGVALVVVAATVLVGRRLNRLARQTFDAERAADVERTRATVEEANLRLALEATGTGWFRWAPGSEELQWSPAGDTGDGDVPRSIRDALGIVHPAERNEVAGLLATAVQTATPAEIEFRLADPAPPDDEQWVWLHLAPVVDSSGRALVVGLVRDVTARRRAQEVAERAAAREREIARLLQRSLLPERVPEIDGLEVRTRYRAAGPDTVVGGDFYDLTVLDDGAHAIVIGDVCGHGIEAASATSLARHTLRAAAHHATDPVEQLRWLHDALVHSSGHGFVTCAAARGRIVGEAYVLDLALGGHPPPLLVRGGEVTPLGAPGTLLGVVPPTLRTQRYELHPGDRVLLYTDGLTDSAIPRLSEDELVALVRELAGLPIDDFADALLHRSDPIAGSQHDDTALVVVDVVR